MNTAELRNTIKTPIKRPGVGLVIDGKLCDCRACYAGSVGLVPSAVDNWNGRRKCRHNG